MINRVRYLISQDGHEIYITVASFDKTYIQWLRSKRAISLPKGSFLTMTRYGPWLINRAEEIRGKMHFIIYEAAARSSMTTV